MTVLFVTLLDLLQITFQSLGESNPFFLREGQEYYLYTKGPLLIYKRSKESNLVQQIMRLLCYLYTTSHVNYSFSCFCLSFFFEFFIFFSGVRAKKTIEDKPVKKYSFVPIPLYFGL